jgi:hypothetical protein
MLALKYGRGGVASYLTSMGASTLREIIKEYQYLIQPRKPWRNYEKWNGRFPGANTKPMRNIWIAREIKSILSRSSIFVKPI